MNGFTAAVFRVLQGVITAQAIGFLALPLLTRQFSPDAFGHFQLFQAISAFVLVITSARYEVALLRADSDDEYVDLTWLCMLICVAASVFVTLVCVIIGLSFEVPPESHGLLWAMPVLSLVGGALQVLTYIVQRQHAFGVGAVAKVVQGATYAGTGTLIGAVAPFAFGLVVADLAGRAASIAAFAHRKANLSAAFMRRFDLPGIVAAARRYREYPLVATPVGLVNTASGVITSALMYGLFSTAVSGQYGLVERAILLPVGMVAGAVAQVYTANLARAIREGATGVQLDYRALLIRLALSGLLPMIVVALAAPIAFTTLFGERWRLAGEFAQIMAPLFLASYVTAPVHMVLTVLGRQSLQAAWDITRLLTLTSVWGSIAYFEIAPTAALAMHTAASIAMMLVYIVLADAAIAKSATQPPPATPPGPIALADGEALLAPAWQARARSITMPVRAASSAPDRPPVTIVDYGVGNIGALKNMLEHLGIDAIASDDPRVIARAHKLILPGVGAFDAAMHELERRDLLGALDEAVLQRVCPVLGVCLGMQLLARGSEEGRARGLGWLAGDVKRIAVPTATAGVTSALKVPHIGWAEVRTPRDNDLFPPPPAKERYYFVHSYHLVCDDPDDVLATIDYGSALTCAVGRGHIRGVQFHPEKSHRFGMRLLSAFAELP